MLARLMGLRTITPDGLHRRMQEGAPVTVIDVNAPGRWAEAHVPGARNLDPAGFDAGALPPDLGTPLVFYCSGAMCRKAPRAARRAREMGYADVHVMSAGIRGWVGARLPTAAAARP